MPAPAAANQSVDYQHANSKADSCTYVNGWPSGEGVRAVIVDGQNLWGAAAERGARPDFVELRDTVAGRGPWLGTVVLGAQAAPESVASLRSFLHDLGFDTRLWTPVPTFGGRLKCDADAAVVCAGTKLLLRREVTELVIVSADSDLRVLAEEAHDLGKRVLVAHYAWQRAQVLEHYADDLIVLDQRELRAPARRVRR